MKYTKREFEKLLKDKLMSECNVTLDMASADQIYRCLAMITRQIMSDRQKQFQSKPGQDRVYLLGTVGDGRFESRRIGVPRRRDTL